MPPHATSCDFDMLVPAIDEIEIELNGKIVVNNKMQMVSPPSSPRALLRSASLFDAENEEDDDDYDDIVEKTADSAHSAMLLGSEDQHCAMIFDSFTNLCAPCTPGGVYDRPLKSALKKGHPSVGPSRSVSFNSLTIREHEMTLGDHPSSASGPPVQLDWKPKTVSTMSLDEYENARQPRRRRRQLKLSFQDREEILQSNGFTMDQLKDAWMESLKVRQQRYETIIQGSLTTKVEEAWESACRKWNRLFAMGDGLDHNPEKNSSASVRYGGGADENTPPKTNKVKKFIEV